MSFINELKRRSVVKVGVAYAIFAWLALQIIDTVLPNLGAPQWAVSTLMVVILLGFPVTLILTWAFEFTPEGIKTQQAADDVNYQPTGNKLNAMIFGVMALVILFLAVDNYVLDAPDVEVEAPSVANTDVLQDEIIATADLEKSIAVLPFANLSDDAEQEYFSDGLSEEILNKLAQVEDLLVAARTSSFFYKGRNEDMRTIGEALGVSYLLEGSVRRAGDSLRITAQLIQADNGFHLWSDTFDRELADVFAIQDEIADAVTTALRVTLGTDEFSLPGSTRNVEAYQYYLQGWALANQGGQQDEVLSYRASEELFSQAVTADPDYARAWLALSFIYRLRSNLSAANERGNFLSSYDQALNRAMELAPDMPELQLRAVQQISETRSIAEEERQLLAILETPSTIQADAYRLYAGLLVTVGRVQEALPYAEQANRLNPMDLGVHNALAAILINLGRLDEAKAVVDRANAFIGDGLGGLLTAADWHIAYEREGPAAWAERVLTFYEDENSAPAAAFNLAAARRMIADDTEAAAEDLRNYAFDPDTAFTFSRLSSRHANMMGEPELALEILNINIRPESWIWAPESEAMRQLPGFKDLVSDYGLVDYWRETGKWGDYCRPLEGNDDFECF